jgi:cbb3-type cytochrome oxidase subunit 3
MPFGVVFGGCVAGYELAMAGAWTVAVMVGVLIPAITIYEWSQNRKEHERAANSLVVTVMLFDVLFALTFSTMD